MNVYVESNFVLELSLLQEQHESCQSILALCEMDSIQLVVPAYALAEPNETLTRRDRSRRQLARDLQHELGQLNRSTTSALPADTIRTVLSLLTVSGEQQRQRLADIRTRLLHSAKIIALDADILQDAATNEMQYGFSAQDALVFTSVMHHLQAAPTESCFLTRNSADFDSIDITEAFAAYGCKLLFSFGDGLQYIQSQI